MSYEIDYNDQQFQQVEADKNAAMADVNNTYNGMINDSTKYYDQQVAATEQWGQQQQQLQQERTDFTVEQINQQKDQAAKDLQKEQSAAYTDWQKQSNKYGVEAEQMAASGMQNTGFSESSQVAMYNTYQNRVAMARESYDKAVLNYNNAIKDAQLQNNSALAEIAFNTLQTSLSLSLEGMQYKNSLLQEKMSAQRETDNIYYQRYQDVISQKNTENAMAEQVRQFNESQAWDKEKYAKDDDFRRERAAVEDDQWNKSFDESKRQFEQNYQLDLDKLAEQIRQYDTSLAEEIRQFDKGYDLDLQKLAEQVRQFDTSLAEEIRQYDQNFAENQRQFNESQAWDKEKYAKDDEYRRGRDAVADSQWNQSFKYQQDRDKVADAKDDRNFAETQRQYDLSHQLDIDRLNESRYQYDTDYDLRYAQFNHGVNMDNQSLALQEKQHNDDMTYKYDALQQDQSQFNDTLAWQKQQKGVSSGSSGSGGSSGSKKITKDDTAKAETTTETTNDGVMVDGVGPLTASALRRKLASGEVIQYTDKKGNVKYKKNPDYKNGKIIQKTTKK